MELVAVKEDTKGLHEESKREEFIEHPVSIKFYFNLKCLLY